MAIHLELLRAVCRITSGFVEYMAFSANTITKNVLYNVLLTLSTYIAQLIVYPYVSRVIGVENMGIIGFVNKTIDVFLLFSALGVGIVGIREVASVKTDRHKLNDSFSSILSIVLLSTILVSVVYVILILCIGKFNCHKELFFIGLAKLIFSTLLIEWFYQGLENFRYITIRNIIIKVLYIIAVFVFVKDKEDYIYYFILTVGVVVLNGLVNWLASRKYVSFKFSLRKFFVYLSPLLVFGLYYMLNALFSTCNYLFLGFLCSDTEVGYYYTAENFYFILISMVSAITRVLMPRMSSLLAKGDDKEFNGLIDKSFNIILSICLPISIVGFIFADSIILLFSGHGYEGAIIPMKILMMLVIINSINQVLIVQIATPLKLDREILIGSAIATVFALLLNYPMAKHMGAVGCTFVLVLSVIVSNIYPIVCLFRRRLFISPWRTIFDSVALSVPYVFFCLIIRTIVNNSVIALFISAFICLTYFFIVKRSFLIELFTSKG